MEQVIIQKIFKNVSASSELISLDHYRCCQFISKNTNQFILRNQIVIPYLSLSDHATEEIKKVCLNIEFRQSRSPQRNPLTTNTSLICNTTNISANKIVKKRGASATIPTDSYRIERRDQVEKRKVSKTYKLTNQEKNNFVRKESKLKEIQRRQEIGLDFLNKIPKKKIQLLLQRQKTQGLSHIEKDIPKKAQSTQNNRLHLKQKNQLHQQQKQNEQMNRKKETKKQLQNSRNILKKSSSQQKCKKRSITSITQKKEFTQRNSSLKNKNEIITQLAGYEGELLEKYKKLQARYSKIYQAFFDESSCVQYLTDTDPYLLPSQPTSNKQQQGLTEEFSLNRDEKIQLKEFGILENKFNRMHSAATKIQKVWRGYITRKLILDQQFEQYYYKQPEVFNEETFRSQFRFEKDSQSIQQGREQTLNQLTHQTDINFILDLESEKKEKEELKRSPKISGKFVRYQKLKWQELINYISELESQVQEKTINEVLQDLKLFTQQCSQDCSLTKFQIKKLEIQVPQFSQESMVMSEIRQAMCSEKLMRQILTSSIKQENESIFEEQPFQQFASKKIDEILNRNQMDELIKMRQLIVQERQKSQHQALTKEFEQKLISPNTFEERYQTLEKWVTKQYDEIENNKIDFEKGWQGLYDTFIQTEKELRFLQQQKYSQLSQISYSQQFINYSISAFSDSAQSNKMNSIYRYKNSLQELSNQNETLLYNNLNEDFENKRLKTHTSTSQTPDEKLRFQHLKNYHETIEWNDEQLLTSQQFLSNQQVKESKINNAIKNAPQKSLEQAEIDYLHQEVQNEELSWVNYNEFKFYVLMDISNLVFNELIEEFTEECIQQQF
ncbi:unnamed protein product (macronuclear) [Paramecium tetraurelia]|uniref:IQ calmodulin-binding motif family protein n=1 Tax=Paramecium tetraurelia TaxID=5888 RepID=A0D284_PARTE|nr:uncharacterized protein GSPATT00012657001 [Paramecium tetraurelia]CAK77151.1 unnamed protein product [Paramecium tetraurelia]|eukprot:XP_001444548.1 hypothetical protein (macronuclear) [Paramecium tetraurelia strain d4-2]